MAEEKSDTSNGLTFNYERNIALTEVKIGFSKTRSNFQSSTIALAPNEGSPVV